MKKSILLALLSIGGAILPLSAQFRYGLRGGIEFTEPLTGDHGDGFASYSGGTGYSAGLTCEYQLPATDFAFGASILFEHRPAYEQSSYPPGSARETYTADVIGIPIEAKYKIPLKCVKELVSPMIITGPDLAFALNGRSERVHFGWNFGVGIDVVNFMQITGGYRLGINKSIDAATDSGGWVSLAFLFDV